MLFLNCPLVNFVPFVVKGFPLVSLHGMANTPISRKQRAEREKASQVAGEPAKSAISPASGKPPAATGKGRVFLIDAMSFIFRAYHAMARNPMSTRTGLPTAATYVFVNMLRKLRADFAPEYLAAVFDTAAPTFRRSRLPLLRATYPARSISAFISADTSAKKVGEPRMIPSASSILEMKSLASSSSTEQRRLRSVAHL